MKMDKTTLTIWLGYWYCGRGIGIKIFFEFISSFVKAKVKVGGHKTQVLFFTTATELQK